MSAAAGWYPDPDPQHPGRLRWWDGATWTEHVSASPAQAEVEAPTAEPEADSQIQDVAHAELPPVADIDHYKLVRLRRKLGYVVVGSFDWAGARENILGIAEDEEGSMLQAVLVPSPSYSDRIDVILQLKIDGDVEQEHVGYLAAEDGRAVSETLKEFLTENSLPVVPAVITDEGETLDRDPIIRVRLY